MLMFLHLKATLHFLLKVVVYIFLSEFVTLFMFLPVYVLL